MKTILLAALMVLAIASPAAATAQNTVVVVPQNGGVVPAPDIAGFTLKEQQVENERNQQAEALRLRARKQAVEEALIRQQTELVEQQTEALARQNARTEQAVPAQPTPVSNVKTRLEASGNEFLESCDIPDNEKTMAAACLAYSMGVGEGIAIFADRGADKQLYCSPEGATVGQQFHVLVKFIKDHPANAHLKTRILMLKAMIDAFPCPVEHPVKP
jgi:hypothetical protein